MNPKLKFIKNQSSLTGNMNVPQTFNSSLLNPPKSNTSLANFKLPATTSLSTGLNQGNKPVMGQSTTTSNPAATSTAPTTITPPTKLPPAGQQYVNSLANVKPTEAPLNPYNPTSGIRPPDTDQTATNAPKAPSATDTAFTEYIKALAPSQQVTSAKSAYNTAVADQSKTTAGFEGQGRGIPLGLVRGTQEKYLRQTQFNANPEKPSLQQQVWENWTEHIKACEAAGRLTFEIV